MQLLNNCVESILDEIKLKNFGFNHGRTEEFVRSQWQHNSKSVPFLIYRWILALFFTGLFLACLVLQFSDGKFFIYLTNWGIMLCSVTNLIAAVISTQWHFNIGRLAVKISTKLPPTSLVRTPIILKFYWLLHGVTLFLAVVISCIYWMFLHGKMNKPVRFPILSFLTHALNSVLMLVDFSVVAFPVRVLHTIYAMMLPIIYCLFTVVYFVSGGTDEYGIHYVYPLLDWTKPARGMTTFAGVFGLYVILSIILFAAYKLKLFLYKSLCLFCSASTIACV